MFNSIKGFKFAQAECQVMTVGGKKGPFYVTNRYNAASTIIKFHIRPVVFNPGCPCESLQVPKKP